MVNRFSSRRTNLGKSFLNAKLQGAIARRSTNTTRIGGEKVIMRTDGNLVLYSSTKALWSSNSDGHFDSILTIQDDGNLVIYENNITLQPFSE